MGERISKIDLIVVADARRADKAEEKGDRQGVLASEGHAIQALDRKEKNGAVRSQRNTK